MFKIKLVGCFGRVECLVCAHYGVRVDVFNALGRNIHLVLTDRLARRVDLAVDVCQADFVVVDEVERAYTAARKRLYRVAAHAADTENGYARILQHLHGVTAIDQLRSGKLVQHISSLLSVCLYIAYKFSMLCKVYKT